MHFEIHLYFSLLTASRIHADVYVLYYFTAAANPCAVNNGNCTYMCLLSATNPSGYNCSCPTSLVLAENQRDCISK